MNKGFHCHARRRPNTRGVVVVLLVTPDGQQYELAADDARQLGKDLLISAGIGVQMVKAELRTLRKAAAK